MGINSRMVQDLIHEALDEFIPEGVEGLDEFNVQTFEDAEILTDNKGLVIEFSSGDEFQISIVRSRRGRG